MIKSAIPIILTIMIVCTFASLIYISYIATPTEVMVEKDNSPAFMTNGEWKYIIFGTKPIEEVLYGNSPTS